MLLPLLLAFAPADSVRYTVSFPNAVHHEARIVADFPAARPGHARGLDEPLVAGAVRAARVRQERVRRERHRRRGPAAHRGAPRPVPLARGRARTGGALRLHALRAITGTAPTRRSTPPTRTSTCPRRSPGRAGWRSGPWRCASPRRKGAAGGWRPSSSPARTPSSWARAGPGVLHGQPDRAERLRAAQLDGGGSRRAAPTRSGSRCTTRAPTPSSTPSPTRHGKVVAEQVGIFGETAQYDHHVYTFLADYLPWVTGDGMEHRNSTVLTSTGSLARNAMQLLAHAVARVLPLVEHGADPRRPRSSRSISPGPIRRTSSGSARDSPTTTTGSPSAARA